MNTQRLVAALAGATILSLGLAACSSSAGGSGGSGAGSKALTVEDYYQGNATGYDAIYAECAKQVGVTVKASHVAGAGLVSKVLQQASSKTLPDVLMLDNPDVQQIAATGALSPLSAYGLDGKGSVPAVVAAGSSKGTLYGLAPVVNSIALYYNVDQLKAAGITPPKTWDELRAAAKKLTDKSKGRYGFAMSNINTYEGTWQFLPFFWTAGGDEKNIDTPEAAKALQLVNDLQNDGSMSKSSITWAQSDVNNQFIAGKAAMMINGPWQLPALNAAKGLHFASVPIPTPDSSTSIVSPLGGETYTVPNTGDKAKMALAGKFVGCLNSAAMQPKVAAASGNVPSNEVVAAAWAKTHPQVASVIDTVKTARARTAELGEKWPTAATAIYTAVQLALTGKATPADALQQAQAQNK
ncbi:sugar ABC transporter substrate-binding protein [Microbacterium mangrovi]|uniref:Sugar ABC transporter substrate-binding protein n=1 Tax=Microbacterium mangrovi TaxID=1348253 RepID=A0A0B2A4A5_9MICO|nr:extracellular solute-binding protein [Microbacterium mangrovi]KHK96418.1 sugar ABC transporter substrate-binding protein [Microbacterium mangrovi]